METPAASQASDEPRLSRLASGFKDAWYCSDRRTLGAFRIVLGLVCLLDVARRLRWIGWFYGGTEGLTLEIGSQPFVTLLPVEHAPLFAYGYFAAAAVAALFFMVGLFTRASQLATVLLFVFGVHSTAFPHYSGDFAGNALLLISLFLPVGDRYSVDAWRARRRGIAPPPDQVQSLGVTLLTFQMAMIYLLTFMAKVGDPWLEGTAVHYLLELDTSVTTIGAWTREWLPDWASAVMSHGTLAIELLVPFLILSPFGKRRLRVLVWLQLLLLHGSIALLADIHVFSGVMLAGATGLLSGESVGAVAAWLTRGRVVDAARLPTEPRPLGLLGVLREGAAGLLFVWFVTLWVTTNEPMASWWSRKTYRTMADVSARTGLMQRWFMFAPSPPLSEDRLVVDGELTTGEHVDLLSGAAVDLGPARAAECTWYAELWRKHVRRVQQDETGALGVRLREWAIRRWESDPARARVANAQVLFILDLSPRPGQGTDAKVIETVRVDVPHP